MQDKGYNLEKGSKFVLLYRNYIEKGHANGMTKKKKYLLWMHWIKLIY